MFLNIFFALILIIGWLLALYGLIITKAPNLKDEYDKVIPLQWWVWIILLLMGIRDFFHIFSILWMISSNFIYGTLWLLTLFTKLILWFVLSFWLITKYILSPKTWKGKSKVRKKTSKSKKAKTASAEVDWELQTKNLYKTLTKIQVPFGIIAVILWFLALILTAYYAIF